MNYSIFFPSSLLCNPVPNIDPWAFIDCCKKGFSVRRPQALEAKPEIPYTVFSLEHGKLCVHVGLCFKKQSYRSFAQIGDNNSALLLHHEEIDKYFTQIVHHQKR